MHIVHIPQFNRWTPVETIHIMPQSPTPWSQGSLSLCVEPQTADFHVPDFHRLSFSVNGFKQKYPLHLQVIHRFQSGEIGGCFALSFEGIFHFQLASTMRTTDRLAFSLVVELRSAIATSTLPLGSTERNMFQYVSHRPLHGFWTDGGQLLVDRKSVV